MRLPVTCRISPALFVAAAIAAATPVTAHAQTLTTARGIAAHVTPKDAPPAQVSLEGTVTFQDPGLTIFLQDETGATFIRAAKDNPKVARGERLRIEGETHTGLIIGGIKPARIERLGGGRPIASREVTPDDLASGRYHYHWVTLSGVGRSIRSDDENTATLRLNTGGKIIDVRFDEAPDDASALVDAELRINGLAAGDINDRRQLVMPYIRVGSMADVHVLQPPSADPFSAEEVPLAELRSASANGHRVKIRGVALARSTAGGLFLRGEDRSVFVQSAANDVKAGDVVEALGFPEMGIFSARLSDAECRVIGTAAPPLPLAVTTRALANGTDGELITLEATVLQRVERDSHTEVLAKADTVSLNVICPEKAGAEVQPEAKVQLTGLCRVASTRSNSYRATPTAYHLWLRSMDDVVVLGHAPWWTPQRLAVGLGLVALLALAGFVWAVLLRRQVARQLGIIQAKVQREAITEERQRIAREFHDTLEQELAGLSLRLDATVTRVTDEKARNLLDQQRKLLQRLQTETRDFVWDLREPGANDVPPDKALASLLSHLQVTTAIPIKLNVPDALPPLDPMIQHHLLRIAREAVNNAIKYSRASEIGVSLERADGVLKLEVTDNGIGFELAMAQYLESRFGIRGMHERAKKTGAALDIRSEPGNGTHLSFMLPVSKDLG